MTTRSSRVKPLVGGMVLVLLAVVSMAVTGSRPAFAVDQARQQLPIVAGTELIFTGGKCTAGLVLQANGLVSNITSYQRAVRYVLTAGHCANVNEAVGVVTPDGAISVGTVYWKSGVSDLALVRIEPSAQRVQVCGVTPSGPACTITVNYTPRAAGRVLMSAGSIPVTGTGSPNDTEVFCTSGKNTNVLCTWHTYTHDPPITGAPAGIVYAETVASNVDAGDSGSPVVSRSGGVVYGIIKGAGKPDRPFPTTMSYTVISQFFTEQPGYSLAPA